MFGLVHMASWQPNEMIAIVDQKKKKRIKEQGMKELVFLLEFVVPPRTANSILIFILIWLL